MSSPSVIIAKPPRQQAANGILPMPNTSTVTAKSSKVNRTAGPRLKVVIRKLPPALTVDEFVTALGPKWAVNAGCVDWLVYKQGKVHSDLSKMTRPSRVYLHLTDPVHLGPLSEVARTTEFIDAKNTWSTSLLYSTPILEFAPYGRVPSRRARTDARQGLIDQDPDFILFLRSLTDPIAPRHSTDSDDATKKEEKVHITPLVQYLKDKKAAKAKDGAAGGKNSRHSRAESKDKPIKQISSKASSATTASSDSKRRLNKSQVDKVAREAVKVLSKEATKTKETKSQSAPVIERNPDHTRPSSATPTAPASERRRERGSAAAAARMLQKDLGLAQGSSKRSKARESKSASKPSPSSSPLKQSATLTKPVSSTRQGDANASNLDNVDEVVYPPADEQFVGVGDMGEKELEAIGPKAVQSKKETTPRRRNVPAPKPGLTPQMILKKPPTEPAADRSPQPSPRPTPATTESSSQGNPASVSAAPASESTSPAKNDKRALEKFPYAPNQAFLKHANPSQGITEPLILAAFGEHGAVSKVEIDVKKGFAYVTFENREALQSAIKASPIRVAQGQVQVLERSEKKGHAFRKDAGGGTQGGRAKAARGIFKHRGNRGGSGTGAAGGGGGGSSGANGPSANSTAASKSAQTVSAKASTPAPS